jgi:6-phosphofructokinase 1
MSLTPTKQIRIAIATPGGDAPGMNACVRAVFKASRGQSELMGFFDGAVGLIRGNRTDFRVLKSADIADRIDRAGTILRSARPEDLVEVLGNLNNGKSLLESAAIKIAETLNRIAPDGLILLGGDTTCEVARKLGKLLDNRVPIVVVPATIDNDVFGTCTTLGFDSAVQCAVEAIDKIRQTATALSRTFIVEVMGRDSGSIAAHVGIAVGAEEILVPEHGPYDEKAIQDLAERVRNAHRRSCILVVAEGIKLPSNDDLTFSAGIALERLLQPLTNNSVPIRTTVLGHLQRGATPTAATRLLAARAGVAAYDFAFGSAGRAARSSKARVLPQLVAFRNSGEIELVKIPSVTRTTQSSQVLELVKLASERLSY